MMQPRLLVALVVAGCASAPEPVDLLRPREGPPVPERRFELLRPDDVEPAVVTVLQDFGFQIAASERVIGLVIGRRGEPGDHAGRTGQYMGQVMKNFVTLQWHGPQTERYGGPVGLSAAVMVTPLPSATAVRLTLHRFVEKPGGEAIVVWTEEVPGPQAHGRFFEQLEKALGRRQ